MECARRSYGVESDVNGMCAEGSCFHGGSVAAFGRRKLQGGGEVCW